MSVALADRRGAGITPMKAMLAREEANLLLLSPDAQSRVYQMDIERGKVVAEWSFCKDGVDVPMVGCARCRPDLHLLTWRCC